MIFPSIQEVNRASRDQLKDWFLCLRFSETEAQTSICNRIVERCQEMGVFDSEFKRRSHYATAIHEAAHAVIAVKLGLKVTNVRILSWEEGYCEVPRISRSMEEAENRVVSAGAGQWAEARFATRYFRRLCSRKDDEDVENLLDEICAEQSLNCRADTHNRLQTNTVEEVETHEQNIKRVADELFRIGELTGEQVENLL